MKEGFSLECFVDNSISCALEIASKNPNLLEYEREFYGNLSSKTGLDENKIRYLSNPIYWELFCNYNNSILMIKDLNLDSINKKILYYVHKLNFGFSILDHPKNKCLSQTTPFKAWWHIVFLI